MQLNDILPKGSVAVIDKGRYRSFAGYYVDKKLWHFVADSPFFRAEISTGDIFKGKVTRTVGRDGAFIDVGLDDEVFYSGAKVSQGDLVLAQIIADEHELGYKATANITFTNIGAVLLPTKPLEIGYSKKLSESTKQKLKERENVLLDLLKDKIGKGKLIIRTGAGNCDFDKIIEYVDRLVDTWLRVKNDYSTVTKVGLLKKGDDPIQSFIVDFLPNVDSVVTNDEYVIETAKSANVQNVLKFDDEIYTFAQAIEYIGEITEKEFYTGDKKSNIRFEYNQTCTFIDVNSGNFSADKKDLARRINLLSVDEIARQICLKNVSGALVVDFITDDNKENQNELIKALRKSFAHDFVKVKVYSQITALGHVEIERERKSPKSEYKWLNRGKHDINYEMLKMMAVVNDSYSLGYDVGAIFLADESLKWSLDSDFCDYICHGAKRKAKIYTEDLTYSSNEGTFTYYFDENGNENFTDDDEE